MIPIHENYKEYQASPSVLRSVTRLLSFLPPGHLAGLESVVLTNSAAVGKGKTKRIRGRKYRASECRGTYYPAKKSAAPWIEIVVDNVLGPLPPLLLRSKFIADVFLAKTVFHEVGHHLDATIGSPSRTGEQAADSWSDILRRQYFRKQYPVLTYVIRKLKGPMRPVIKRNIAEAKNIVRSGS